MTQSPKAATASNGRWERAIRRASRLRHVRSGEDPNYRRGESRTFAQHLVLVIAVVLMCATIAFVALSADDRLLQPMTAVLLACMVLANITEVRWATRIVFSAAFMCAVIAVVFLGIANALAILIAGELIDWLTFRYRLVAVPFNIVSFAVPTILGGSMIVAALPPEGPVFWIVLMIASVIFLVTNFFTVTTMLGIYDANPRSAMNGALLGAAPGLAISVLVVMALVAVLETAGTGAAALALIGISAINTLMRQIAYTQQLARRYFALGWGTVASLMQILDEREQGTLDAAATAAALAADAAERLGLDEADRQVVHSAALLRDIGRLAATDEQLAAGGSRADIRRGAALTASLDPDGAIAATIRDSADADARNSAAQLVVVATQHAAMAHDAARQSRTLVDLGRSTVDEAITAAVGHALQARREPSAEAIDFDAELAVSQRWARRQMRLT